jgi:glycosyltransferase involved in cell wall biosynthesis
MSRAFFHFCLRASRPMAASFKAPANILWLVDHLGFGDKIHGAGMYYLNIIPGFDPARFGIHLGILRESKNLMEYAAQRNIQRVHTFGTGKYDPSTICKVLAYLRREKISLIHTHGYGSNNFGRIAGKIAGIPTIVHTHDPLCSYPLVQRIADRLLAPLTDYSIAVSSSIRQAANAKRKIPPEKTEIFRTCIPMALFSPPARAETSRLRQELKIPAGCKVIGTIGRLHPQKGLEFLLRAAPAINARFPEALFLIVGDGPLRASLAKLASELDLSGKTIFAGYREDVRKLLGVIDIKVIPSLWEGTPIALLEAMALGKSIVATAVDGMKEVLEHGRTALLVHPGEPAAIAEAVCLLLEDEALASTIGANALQESRKYDAIAAADKLQDLYRKILGERARPKTALHSGAIESQPFPGKRS